MIPTQTRKQEFFIELGKYSIEGLMEDIQSVKFEKHEFTNGEKLKLFLFWTFSVSEIFDAIKTF